MESNEVKRFKAMIREIIDDFDTLIVVASIISIVINIILGIIIAKTCNKDIGCCYITFGILIPYFGGAFLVKEHDDEE